MRCVMDCNVIVSALLLDESKSRLAFDKYLELAVSGKADYNKTRRISFGFCVSLLADYFNNIILFA